MEGVSELPVEKITKDNKILPHRGGRIFSMHHEVREGSILCILTLGKDGIDMNAIGDIRLVQTPQELEDALQVRRIVFIDEQQVPEELEMDEHDTWPGATFHFVGYLNGTPVAAARLRPYEPGVGKVERVAVHSSARGTGLGKQIMLVLELHAREQGFQKLKLNAQCHAQAFYEKLGYIPYGEVFDEAGIDHIAMQKTLE